MGKSQRATSERASRAAKSKMKGAAPTVQQSGEVSSQRLLWEEGQPGCWCQAAVAISALRPGAWQERGFCEGNFAGM